MYKGQKIWIERLSPNKILHKEIVSVYCMDKANCGYAVPTQCIDGKVKIPECFEGKKYLMTKHEQFIEREHVFSNCRRHNMSMKQKDRVG